MAARPPRRPGAPRDHPAHRVIRGGAGFSLSIRAELGLVFSTLSINVYSDHRPWGGLSGGVPCAARTPGGKSPLSPCSQVLTFSHLLRPPRQGDISQHCFCVTPTRREACPLRWEHSSLTPRTTNHLEGNHARHSVT